MCRAAKDSTKPQAGVGGGRCIYKRKANENYTEDLERWLRGQSTRDQIPSAYVQCWHDVGICSPNSQEITQGDP